MLPSRPLPPGFILPCLPTPAKQCKSGPAWVHEIAATTGADVHARSSQERRHECFGRSGWWAPAEPHAMGVQQQES
jgi:hypothetical protein